jgi:Fe-S-cluster formation regulator IscX/YfhJ
VGFVIMTFTYLGNLSTDLDTIRFRVQDTVENAGVKPNSANFTDEEINGLFAFEGDVNRTVAALYEALATAWANFIDTKVGSRDEKLSQVADRYGKLAAEARDAYGHGGASIIVSDFVTRVDGYSDDVNSAES